VVAHTDLYRFSKTTLQLPEMDPRDGVVKQHKALEWETAGRNGLLERLKRKPAWQWGCTWVEKKKNRILGIVVEDAKPLDKKLCEQLVSQYGSV
jgi:hypothetical protein